MFKKFILSALVLGIFTLYVIHNNLEGSDTPVIAVNTPASKYTAVILTPSPSQTPVPTAPPAQTTTIIKTPTPTSTPSGRYKNGTYTGNIADAFYGNVQVQVTISGGQIADVQFLQYPNDRSTSRMINSQAMPLLKQEAIQAQSAQVDGVSGATATSGAFIQSLTSALQQAT